MSTSDAFVVVGDWVSEHYFTTEAKSESFLSEVTARRKEWETETAEERATPRTRFLEVRSELETAIAGLEELSAGKGRTTASACTRSFSKYLATRPPP